MDRLTGSQLVASCVGHFWFGGALACELDSVLVCYLGPGIIVEMFTAIPDTAVDRHVCLLVVA